LLAFHLLTSPVRHACPADRKSNGARRIPRLTARATDRYLEIVE
jgi:hypothetical protein